MTHYPSDLKIDTAIQKAVGCLLLLIGLPVFLLLLMAVLAQS
jgi:hypothetical protein